MMKPKRVRRTCDNCGKVNYPKARDIDPGTHHLCDRCDDAYIMWQNTAPEGVHRFWLSDFLKSNAARRCKASAN